MMAKLPKEKLDRGVVCSSAGNHAQGVALAAKRLNCDAVIVMPVTTPEIKVIFCLIISCLELFCKNRFIEFVFPIYSGNRWRDWVQQLFL